MTWIIVTAIAYFLTAVNSVLDKYLLNRSIPEPVTYAFYVGIFSIFTLVLTPFGFHWPGLWQFIAAILTGAIFLLALIEHVQSPLPLLTEARRVLKPGGTLVLTTPSPQSRLVLELMARLRLISREEIEEHKHYYSPPEVYKLLTSAGFATSDISCARFEVGLNVVARAIKS